jgi:hypothetical protein
LRSKCTFVPSVTIAEMIPEASIIPVNMLIF